jgi:hypothetical protein
MKFMINNKDFCNKHSGHEAEIENLKRSDSDQWASMKEITQRLDSFSTRMNVTLGGVAVSCILLAVNIMLMRGG